MPPALKRFKFLAAKMSQPQSSSSNAMALTLATPRSVSVAETTRSQLVQYFAELQNWQHNPVSSAGIQSTSTNTSASTGGSTDALQFWKKNSNLNKLAPIAQDLICAPASQAFVERVFSLWHPHCRASQQHETIAGVARISKTEQTNSRADWIYCLVAWWITYNVICRLSVAHCGASAINCCSSSY